MRIRHYTSRRQFFTKLLLSQPRALGRRVAAYVQTAVASLVLVSLLISHAPPAIAAPLLIQDCQGFTRALHEATPGEPHRVEVNINSSPTSNPTLTLTELSTGDILTSVAYEGVATFENVPAGVFVLGTTSENVAIGVIGIGPMYAAIGTAAVVGGATVVGIGGVSAAVIVGVNELTSSDSEDPAPPAPPPPPPPPPIEEPCQTCNPEATPPPLDPDDLLPPQPVVLSPSS